MKSLSSLAVALYAGLSAEIAAADVTLINVFEVPEGERATVIEQWEHARDFLKDQPGYISTALHASINEGTRFELINIAQWKTVEDFKAATTALRTSSAYPQLEGLGINPGIYKIIRTDYRKGWAGPLWMRQDAEN